MLPKVPIWYIYVSMIHSYMYLSRTQEQTYDKIAWTILLFMYTLPGQKVCRILASWWMQLFQFSVHGSSSDFLTTFDEHASQLLNTFPPVCFYQSLQRTPVTSILYFRSATITIEWLYFIIFFTLNNCSLHSSN